MQFGYHSFSGHTVLYSNKKKQKSNCKGFIQQSLNLTTWGHEIFI